MRLFCLPHAGGSARRLARVLDARLTGAEVLPLEPAGRGRRWREHFYAGWNEATLDLVQRLTADLGDGEPYGLLGHSVGALFAYEVAVGLAERAVPPPGLLVVCGRNPPHHPPQATLWHATDLPDEELFAVLVRLGGASPRAAGPLTYHTFLSGLRNDLRLAATYPSRALAPLTVPVVALYGRDDPLTSGPLMPEWGHYTTAAFAVHECRGGHFFPLDRADEVAEAIEQHFDSPHATSANKAR